MTALTQRAMMLQVLVRDFITSRLNDKLDKLSIDDPKCQELALQYHPKTWLEDAARRVGQLQLVTHPLKASHPDARGSSLFVPPATLPPRREAGSHVLPGLLADVVGNAAALDVYKFLKLEHEGQSLLALLQAKDADLLAALSDDPEQATAWCDAFCSIVEPASGPASHSRAKQIYWPVAPTTAEPPDPHQDAHFHLLAPLYSSSLSHWLYQRIQQDRFSDEAKAARQARREGAMHPHGYSDYPGLAEEKKGGTKPQNISQLNSERKGSNYLLASLPPIWSSNAQLLYKVDSLFIRFGQRQGVRRLLREFRLSLRKQNQPSQIERKTMQVRDTRDDFLEQIFEELLQFGGSYINEWSPGWTAHPDCCLPIEQQCWLDPRRAETDEAFNKVLQWQDWPQQLAESIARWLNAQLGDAKLQLTEVEFDYWRRELSHEGAWQAQVDRSLHQQGSRLLPAARSPQSGGAA